MNSATFAGAAESVATIPRSYTVCTFAGTAVNGSAADSGFAGYDSSGPFSVSNVHIQILDPQKGITKKYAPGHIIEAYQLVRSYTEAGDFRLIRHDEKQGRAYIEALALAEIELGKVREALAAQGMDIHGQLLAPAGGVTALTRTHE